MYNFRNLAFSLLAGCIICGFAACSQNSTDALHTNNDHHNEVQALTSALHLDHATLKRGGLSSLQHKDGDALMLGAEFNENLQRNRMQFAIDVHPDPAHWGPPKDVVLSLSAGSGGCYTLRVFVQGGRMTEPLTLNEMRICSENEQNMRVAIPESAARQIIADELLWEMRVVVEIFDDKASEKSISASTPVKDVSVDHVTVTLEYEEE